MDHLNLDGYEFCQLEIHKGLWMMEYNPLSQTSIFITRSVQLYIASASPNIWYYRFAHYGPDVIQHLSEGWNGISITDGWGPGTNEYETCAIAKAHEMISRWLAQRESRPFGCVHFDLIEFDQGFDGSRYVIHFLDDMTWMQWTYLLSNKQQLSLLTTIKYFVNMVEWTYSLEFGVAIFRTDQESGIGKDIERWLKELGLLLSIQPDILQNRMVQLNVLGGC